MPERGKTVSHYTILNKLGAGGMGEVYLAEDSTLKRQVALKILPAQFTEDPERLARFRREAQVLASLNNPNIAAIYGLEEADGKLFLILELVEGETLAQRIHCGPLPLEESLELCRQLAAGLESAHAKGIVHRDLKPANIMITPDGRVKILDFGLARALAGESAGGDPSQSPTITGTMTRPGVILGTAAYMSPEQARGKPADKRTDIWAFGCVLYECLTGKQLFSGEAATDMIAKILQAEPDWTPLPTCTPVAIQLLLRRCLRKEAGSRLHDIADARIEIEEAISSPAAAVPVQTRPAVATMRRNPLLLTAAALIVFAAIANLIAWKLKPTALPAHGPVMRFAAALPPAEQLAGTDFPSVALSPTGAHLAYVASRGGSARLFLRSMDSAHSEPMPGTEQALCPFFSPDGQWVGFFMAGKLMKASINGGPPVVLCDAPTGFGGAWGPDDTITFAPTAGSGLWRVPAAGGTATQVTKLDSNKGEFSHRWPELLPDGKTVLFSVSTVGSWDDAQIIAASLDTGERYPLIAGGTFPRYLPTGYLIYMRSGTLMAVPFDAAHRKITGTAAKIVPNVWESADGAAQLSLTPFGHLVYVQGGLPGTRHTLVWVSRNGTVEPLAAPPDAYADPRLSSDGRRLAVTITQPSENVWIYDIPTGKFTQLTFEGNNSMPVWVPDGARMTFTSDRTGPLNLFWKRTDEGGTDERLATSDQRQAAHSWSHDGRLLVYVESSPSTGRDIWMLSSEGDRSPVIQAPFNQDGPALSPNDRWLAYVSDESGTNEVYVTAFPGAAGKWRISTEGGTEPLWNHEGSELFYRAGNRMMAVKTTTTTAFTATTPRLLFEGAYEKGKISRPAYDVAADGTRFLMVKNSETESAATEFQFILEWSQELKRRVSK